MKLDNIEPKTDQLIRHFDTQALEFIYPDKITDNKTLEEGNVALKEANKLLTSFETARKDSTKPFLDKQRAINERFKSPITVLQNHKETIRNLIKEYMDKLKAEAEIKRKKAEELVKEDSIVSQVQAVELADEANKPPPPVNRTMVRDRWEVEIVDLSLVPREYLIPDMSKLKKLAAMGMSAPDGIKYIKS